MPRAQFIGYHSVAPARVYITVYGMSGGCSSSDTHELRARHAEELSGLSARDGPAPVKFQHDAFARCLLKWLIQLLQRGNDIVIESHPAKPGSP